MKKTLQIFFIITLLVGGILYLRWTGSGHDRFSTEPVRFQLGDYEYAIPRNYLIYDEDPKCHHTVTSLEVLVPGFEGRTPENAAKFRLYGKDNVSARVLMTIYMKKGQEALRNIFRGRLKTYFKTSEPPVEVPLNDALIEYTYPGKKKYGKEDFFADSHEKPLERFIQCGEVNSVPAPHCQHHFVVNDAISKISYHRKFLSQWKEIESNARTYLKQWTVKPIQNKLPACDESLDSLKRQ